MAKIFRSGAGELTHGLQFRYRYAYDSRAAGITVPVVLGSGGAHVELLANVDTGATFCIFQRLFAEVLRIDVESGRREKLWTANSSFVAFGHEVTIEALGLQMTTEAFFFKDESLSRNVLGRRGWFDRVRVGLIDHDSTLFLSDYND